MNYQTSKLFVLLLLAFSFSSCGLFSKRSAEQMKAHPEQAAVHDPKKVEEKPAPVMTPPQEPTTVAAPPQEPKTALAPSEPQKKYEISTPVVPPTTSLGWLKNGNIRFTSKHFRADGRTEKDRARLAKGQHPHAIVLSCSDSRVPPEIVFDQTLGEIFVIRVIGEALDSSVIASIEYAVEHLHIGLLVVMGHSQCGAIQATVKTQEGSSAGSPEIDKVISDIRPRLASLKNEPESTNLEVESTLNADGVARDLVKRSSLLKSAVDTGNLVIKSALYRVDTGKVTFY